MLTLSCLEQQVGILDYCSNVLGHSKKLTFLFSGDVLNSQIKMTVKDIYKEFYIINAVQIKRSIFIKES